MTTKDEPTVDLLEVYKIAVDEEHKELETHHKRVIFFSSAVSAVFLVALVGIRFAAEPKDYFTLAVVPLLILPLARLGKQVSRQFYERFLSAVTTRAKLEQQLGLTKSRDAPAMDASSPEEYWRGEPLVPTRNLESRFEWKDSSKEWADARMKGGYQRSAQQYFTVVEASAWILSAVMLVIGVTSS